MWTYYYFRSEYDPCMHAFTDDPTGEKLPAENGPWTLVNQLSADTEWTHEVSKTAVDTAVRENGFALWDECRPTVSKPVIESDRVEGTAVYDREGKHIGTIKRLVIEKVSGRVVYADIVFGGFLGLGSHHDTIPWEKLNYDTGLGGYRTDVTEDQLRGAPPFQREGETWPSREREQKLHDFWRTLPYWRNHPRE
jgi:sporulation protein YlmC with PRC-barrel domain